jgi:NAD(P)-dependent dehydrogenase (short-subunit alcohol dehydrogenase family)
MKDKVVLVTGAGRGIGKAIAARCAAAGAVVVVNDINPDAAEATVKAITQSGGQALAIIADVAQKLAVQTMHYEILDRFGRVDVLVNNARVEPEGSLLTCDEWTWDRTINVNLKGAFLCTQTVARGMKEQGGGVIVNISRKPNSLEYKAAFFASHSGLVGFTQEAAREFLAYNIRVNAVHPGAPAATAERVLWLCSDEAKAIAGQVFSLDD